MLGVLASYSITVKELKLLFGAMKAVNGKWVSIIYAFLFIIYTIAILLYVLGCAVAQVVSCRRLTAEAGSHPGKTVWGLWWTKWHWGKCFSEFFYII
jgi:hypothetical protein